MAPSSKSPSPTNARRSETTLSQRINANQWSAALESSLAFFSPFLSPSTVLRTLSRITAPKKAFCFFNWVRKIGFAHDRQTYFAMLEILGRSRHLGSARNLLFSIEDQSGGAVKLDARFFNSLIRSHGDAGLFRDSVRILTTMKGMGVSPSVVTFHSLLSVLLKRGRTKLAKRVFHEMLHTYGVSPDTRTFNILIRGFCLNSMLVEGLHLFKEMEHFKCAPDVITYNTLVDGLCRNGKHNVARNVLRGMCKEESKVRPNIITYTTLVRGYCVKGDIPEALNVYEEMGSRGMKPNAITYNTLIQGLCEARRMDKIKEILDGAMGRREFIPDTCTFNTLINAHCSLGRLDEALGVFEKMSQLRVQSDSATYSTLIRNLCLEGGYERAEELFDQLLEKRILLCDFGCKPLVAAYNIMFDYLCRNGKTKKAEIGFRQLLNRGTQDPPTYKILIMGHCKEGVYEAGYELMVLMLRMNFSPDVEIYESLIKGLLQTYRPLLAYKTLEKMLKTSHVPNAYIFHLVLAELVKSELAWEAASIIILMLQNSIRQNINLSTETMMLLFRRRLCDKAFETLELLHETGYTVKMEELIGFLLRREMLLEAHRMLLFGLEKLQRVDVDMCSAVISGLCKLPKLSEAFGLFYELVERGMHQQLHCLEELKAALESNGRLKEVDFLSKRMPNKQQEEDASATGERTTRGRKEPRRPDGGRPRPPPQESPFAFREEDAAATGGRTIGERMERRRQEGRPPPPPRRLWKLSDLC